MADTTGRVAQPTGKQIVINAFKSTWYIAVPLGAVIGFIYSKKTNSNLIKSVIAGALLGGAIGGVGKYAVQKFKK